MKTFTALSRNDLQQSDETALTYQNLSPVYWGLYRNAEKFKDEYQGSLDTKVTASLCVILAKSLNL